MAAIGRSNTRDCETYRNLAEFCSESISSSCWWLPVDQQVCDKLLIMTSVADSVIFGNILSTSESAEIWSDTSKHLQAIVSHNKLFAAEHVYTKGVQVTTSNSKHLSQSLKQNWVLYLKKLQMLSSRNARLG